MRLPITVALALLATAALRAEAPPVTGTMPEDYIPSLRPLLKEAVERSPSTITASIALAGAEANAMSSASILWPSVSANAGFQDSRLSEKNALPQYSKGPSYGASIYQPVFQWGAYRNQKVISDLAEKIAERQFADAYRSLAIAIRENYLGLIAKRIALRNAQFNLKLALESLEAQKARFEAGSSSQAELGNFRMSVDDAQLAADRSTEDLGYSKRVFTRMVGIEDLADDSIPIELPHPEFNATLADTVLAGFVGDGIESTFQSEMYQLELRQQDLQYSIAKVRLLPKVFASASYNFSNQSNYSSNSISVVAVTSESANLSANWTLFDGFATRAAKLSALAGRRTIERQRQTYIDSTVDAVTNMRHQLGFSVRAMSLAEVHDALFKAQVERLGQDKTLGYASQATVDSGILTLYAYDYLMANARADYYSHWTEFISIAGIDPALANLSSRYVR